jgi:hypothetical protein
VVADLDELANGTEDVRDGTSDHHVTAAVHLMSHAGEAILSGAREAASKVGLSGG